MLTPCITRNEAYSKEKADAISKLQTIYETEKKDNEIKLLNADNDLQRKQQKYLLAILFLSVVLLVLAVWAFLRRQRDNRLLKRQKAEIESKTEQLKEQAAHIARLSSQMNPHFLFNALNSLQKFVLTRNEDKSLGYISQLSALMRDTLNNSTRPHITLAEESAYLQKYLQFEQNLIGEDLRFTIDTQALDTANTLIAPMLVQPLVENAVKHGLATKDGEKHVLVRFEKGEGSLRIIVRDNGVGRKGTITAGHQSKALGIMQSRLRAEFEKHKQQAPANLFVITDIPDSGGTEVTLLAPLVEEF